MLRHWMLSVVFVLSLGWLSTAQAGQQEAVDYATSIGNQALEILSAEETGEVKQQKLEALFTEIVDTNWIGRFVVGASWRRMNEEQKQDYLNTYRRFLVKHYTQNFKEYTEGTTFKVTKARPIGSKNQFLVTVAIIRTSNPQPVNIDYRLREGEDGSFRAIDIVVEGVSLLATQRSEFSSVIQRDGLEKLISLLKKKAA